MMPLYMYILDINQIASGYRKHAVRKTTAYKQQLNFEDMLSGTEATVSLTSLSSTPDSSTTGHPNLVGF